MRRVLVATVLFALLSGVSIASPSSEEQIRSRVDEFTAAWNMHDPMAMAYFWAVDGDLINPVGRKAKGLTEIKKLFQDEQSTVMKQTTFKVTAQSVRLIDANLALVDTDVEISGVANPDGTTATIKPHVVNLMKKSGGKWWIVAARAYSYTAPPPPAPK